MTNEYVLATNDDGDLAVRTVSATEASGITDTQNVITRTEDGKLAIRTVGGGGDKHNLGYYATQAALEEAHPTAEAGDWAIVGATDTVWVWDSDNNQWVDSDQKGQVTSVNNQTGDVSLTASDVGALPTSGGTITGRVVLAPTASLVPTHANQRLGSSSLPFGIIYAGAFSDGEGTGKWFVPVGDGNTSGIFVGGAWSMPSPSADLDSFPILYLGTTDSNYTHGYIYECVTDDNTTYYWKQLDVQPAGSSYTAGNGISIDANNEISVTAPTLVNQGVSSEALMIAARPFATTVSGNSTMLNTLMFNTSPVAVNSAISIGGSYSYSLKPADYSIGIGKSVLGSYGVGIGAPIGSGSTGAIAIGCDGCSVGNNAPYAIQVGRGSNTVANTFKVGNANGSYEMMNANGNLPADRLASTTGLADGNYRLRLVMASGVPTLEWVAE